MRIYCERGDFDLPDGFTLEISKYNPFVSDAGEQSYPITLKGTPNNKFLTNYSSRLDKRTKPLKQMTVVVQDGTISRKANMVFHSHSNKDIPATLYFSEGNFYSLYEVLIFSFFCLGFDGGVFVSFFAGSGSFFVGSVYSAAPLLLVL